MPGKFNLEHNQRVKEEINMTLTKNLGMLMLGAWLIVTGLMPMISIPVPATVMAILAIISGVLILLGR